MIKKIICIILSILFCFFLMFPANAHNEEEHNRELENVLFGLSKQLKNEDNENRLKNLENAVYLCVDQYNKNGKDKLKALKDSGITGLPEKIEDIDFSSNYAHRKYTHKGWNHYYGKNDKAKWEMRKSILINTVEHDMFLPRNGISLWFVNTFGITTFDKKQSESFCALVYYVHIIGDYSGVNKIGDLVYLNSLARKNDKEEPGIIPELRVCCDNIFKSADNKIKKQQLDRKLERIEKRSIEITSSEGGINTEEEFELYKKYSKDLMDCLEDYLPDMLKKEKFFVDAFYK